jgi:response regulator RpfG family c-di-GMP phosphodiesterase
VFLGDTSTGSAAQAAEVLRVLAVDDSPPLLRFLCTALAANRCTVSHAATAEEALELLHDRQFDLVLSDIKMPGLSGLDLLRSVKRMQPDTPVALITGAPSINSAIFGLRHGAYDYLPKPFGMKEVQELVARVRRDRLASVVTLPAGLTDELARRELGVEALFRIGELALEQTDAAAFVDQVLDYTVASLRARAAVIVLRAEDGTIRTTHRGAPDAVDALGAIVQPAMDRLLAHGGREATVLGERSGMSAIAATISGLERTLGVLCVARDAQQSAWVPDERELLVGYARTTAVALQKMLLRESVERNLVDTIASFVNAIESKDPYLKGHSARVSLYAREIGSALGLSASGTLVAGRAGMLHDLGKLVMLDSILRKPGTLTPEEYGLIQAHAAIGGRILQPLRFLAEEASGVRHHHERFDGTGYPDRLRGADIPFPARIVAVADAFDAMTSDRPYRRARSIDEAREEISSVAGTQLDPAIVEAFSHIPVRRLETISTAYDAPAGAPAQFAPRGRIVRCAQAEAVMAT